MTENDKNSIRPMMPNNAEAESAVLCSILIDDVVADSVIPQLSKQDFYLTQNQEIFEVMCKLQEASIKIDTVSVADALEQAGLLEKVGSLSYIMELASFVASAANVEHYVKIVKRDSLKRAVIHAGNDITKYAYNADEGDAALANAESIVYGLAEGKITTSLSQIADAVTQATNSIQASQIGNVPKDVIYTGFPSFDSMTRGLKPGELVLLAARPSVGKSALALNIAANVSLNSKKPVAIFSLEMPAQLLAKRMLSYVSKVSLSRMDAKGGMTSKDMGQLYKAYNAMLAAPIYIDDYSLNTPSEVLSKCRRLKRERGLGLVIIDYLQLMTMPKTDRGRAPESRQVEVSDMSRKMKIYAKELGCPILVLSQMSRGIEQRKEHTPLLSDLRESGSIEQDADVVMFLNNMSKYDSTLPPNEVILDVKKNRNGPIGEITLEWNGETTSFSEVQGDGASQPLKPSAEEKEDNIAKAAPSDESMKDISSSLESADVFGVEAKDAPPTDEQDFDDEDKDDDYVDDGDEFVYDDNDGKLDF